MSKEKEVSKVQLVIVALVFIIIGVLAVWKPELMDKEDPHGRRFIIKSIIIFLWSRPLGFILIVMGSLSLYGTLTPDRKKEKIENDKEQSHDD